LAVIRAPELAGASVTSVRTSSGGFSKCPPPSVGPRPRARRASSSVPENAAQAEELEAERREKEAAEAERERRAKIINAEGEFQASERLTQAAEVLDRTPTAIQLRYLQTLSEIAVDKSTTTIFPVPIDVISMFMKKN